MQAITPGLVRYLVDDTTGGVGQHSVVQRRKIVDVTERINGWLKHVGISRQLQAELEQGGESRENQPKDSLLLN